MTSRRPSITIDGRLLDESWLVALRSLRLTTGVRTIGRATLVLADPGYTLLAGGRLQIGAEVTVTHPEAGGPLFAGSITAVESDASPGDDVLTTVTVQDHARKLARARTVATFEKVSTTDVIKKVVGGCGLKVDLAATSHTVHPYLVQTDSALGLVDEVAGRDDLDWIVQEKTLAMWPAATGTAPGAASTRLALGTGELLAFSVRSTDSEPGKVELRAWDRAAKRELVSTASPERARAAFVPRRAGAASPGTTVLGFQSAGSQSELDTLARTAAGRKGRVVARGRAVFTPGLRAGGTVTVAGAGPGSGDYYVREVVHTFDVRGESSAFVAGDADAPRLESANPGGPAHRSGVPSSLRKSGLRTAVVDSVRDPDGEGRVRVRFPSAGSTATSAWARVLALGAGPSRGQVVIPEVDDEVLVAFEDDDVRRPVVLGGLFSRNAPSPDVTEQGSSVLVRRTTSRLGHVLEMSDGTAPAKQHVQIAVAKGKGTLRIGADRTRLEVPDGVPLEIVAGRSSLIFDGQGAITLTGTTITIKADQEVTIDGAQVGVKAVAAVAVEGAKVDVRASATGAFTAGANLALKGAVVMIN